MWPFFMPYVFQLKPLSFPHYTTMLNVRSTKKKKQMTPVVAMMMPGTMKDMPQAVETNAPAMSEPRMFPTEVCEFHTPMMNPRLQQQTIKRRLQIICICKWTIAHSEIVVFFLNFLFGCTRKPMIEPVWNLQKQQQVRANVYRRNVSFFKKKKISKKQKQKKPTSQFSLEICTRVGSELMLFTRQRVVTPPNIYLI